MAEAWYSHMMDALVRKDENELELFLRRPRASAIDERNEGLRQLQVRRQPWRRSCKGKRCNLYVYLVNKLQQAPRKLHHRSVTWMTPNGRDQMHPSEG